MLLQYMFLQTFNWFDHILCVAQARPHCAENQRLTRTGDGCLKQLNTIQRTEWNIHMSSAVFVQLVMLQHKYI